MSPINDLRPHDISSADCWCEPELTDDGLLVHNSLDRREEFERGRLLS